MCHALPIGSVKEHTIPAEPFNPGVENAFFEWILQDSCWGLCFTVSQSQIPEILLAQNRTASRPEPFRKVPIAE